MYGVTKINLIIQFSYRNNGFLNSAPLKPPHTNLTIDFVIGAYRENIRESLRGCTYLKHRGILF